MPTFISRCHNQKIFMRPPVRRVENGIVEFIPGVSIQFENGRFTTDDEEIAAFIRKRPKFGVTITEVEDGAPEPPRQPEHVMRRGVTATKTVQTAQGGTGDAYRIPCDYPDCEYVAEDDDENRAIRKLNGHKTRHGHHMKREGGEG